MGWLLSFLREPLQINFRQLHGTKLEIGLSGLEDSTNI